MTKKQRSGSKVERRFHRFLRSWSLHDRQIRAHPPLIKAYLRVLTDLSAISRLVEKRLGRCCRVG